MGDTLISKIFAGVELKNPGQCFTCSEINTGFVVFLVNVGKRLVVINGDLIVNGSISVLPPGTGICNTAFGVNALSSITTGDSNTAIGVDTLAAVTTEDNNTAVGCEALENNTANDNTAVGFRSLWLNTTGDFNTAVGQNALQRLLTGSTNVALGSEAGFNLTSTESDNVHIMNSGITGDEAFIRIGISGTQTDTFHVGNQWAKQGTSTDLADTAPTLTTAQIKTFILRGTPTAARAWTLPTALLMIGTDLNNPQVDDCLDFCIINEATGFDITVTIPGDVTDFGNMVVGDATALSVSALFKIRLTVITGGSEEYQIFRIS